MLKEIVLAGFGGQGIMSMGQLLAYAGMLENKKVSWIPSYGPEMRGGTANCAVCISDSSVSSPLVSEPDVVIAMNTPSLDKFEPTIKPGGTLLINSSLITRLAKRKDINVFYIPVNEKAVILGETRVANMVMLGALLEVEKIVSPVAIMESLKKVLAPSKHGMLPLNAQALEIGAEVVREVQNPNVSGKVS